MIILTRERRIDWARMIDNLVKLGMSEQQIADELDVARTSVQGYRNEDVRTDPAFWVGSCLIVLWSQRTGLSWTDAPTCIVPPSVSRVLRSTA